MKTKANQSAAEKNITMVALADIQPSGFNPRKRFDETSLQEHVQKPLLSQSTCPLPTLLPTMTFSKNLFYS